MSKTVVAAASSLLVSVFSAAVAAPLSGEALLQNFNVVTSGDVQSNSRIHGTFIVGGTLTAVSANSELNTDNEVTDAVATGLTGEGYILGDSAGANINIARGDIFVGGTNGNINNVASNQAIPFSSQDIADAGQALSSFLGGLSGTASLPMDSNQAISSVLGSDGISVLNIDAADLSSINNLSFATSGITTVVNVSTENSGGVFTIPQNLNFNYDPTNSPFVLFNFVDATAVNLTKGWGASILAANATVTMTGSDVWGSIFAAELIQSQGQIHPGLFAGDLPEIDAQVPLPAGALLFAPALGAILLRRRSR